MEQLTTTESSNLQHVCNERFERNTEQPPLYPSFIISKDLRLIPVVCGLPMDEDNELSWLLYDQGYYGVYVTSEAFNFLRESGNQVMIDSITATTILAKPKEEAREEFKRMVELSNG